MKISAIVTALVLASSTAAMAAPQYAPEIRDHRMPPRFESWSLLGQGQLVRGKDTIRVHASKVDKLKLESVRGMMFVDKLVVSFANGRTHSGNAPV